MLAGSPLQIVADSDGTGNLCAADLNSDCMVNALDLGILEANLIGSDPVADMNSDSVINAVERGLLKAAFFGQPGPSGLPDICDGL